jgi:hypothetical protein
MKKLLISIAQKSATSPTVIEFNGRGALFVGSGMQGARMIDADGGAEWIASSELLRGLNGPLFKWS